MSKYPTHYKVAASWKAMAELEGIDPQSIVDRARLRPDFLENEGPGVTPAEFFRAWQVFYEIVGRETMPFEMGKHSASGTFHSATYAFSCSETVRSGLERLALFKPLVGPFNLRLEETSEGVWLRPRSVSEDAPVPASLTPLEVVYFIESIRVCTGKEVVPKAIELPENAPGIAQLNNYTKKPARTAKRLAILLSTEDADLPLLTHNDPLLRSFEREMGRKLAELTDQGQVRKHVREALLRLLPTGKSSADAVAHTLAISKRTLQRRLQEDGVRFQAVLEETRHSLAWEYLAMGDLRVDEISYLLAYQDSNSFYRAFQTWTGMTPMQARATAQSLKTPGSSCVEIPAR